MDETSDRTTQTRAAFCPKCGQRSAGGSYCTRCGEQLAPDAADELASAATQDLSALDDGPLVQDLRPPRPEPVAAPRRPSPPPPAPPAGPSADRPSRGWVPWAILGAVVALVAVGVAVYFLTKSDGKSGDTASYQHEVASTFGPVLGANTSVSRSLSGLTDAKVGAARAAVRQAQSSVSTAQGALGALHVPAGSDELASQARQALAREASYYTAVATILNDAGSPTADEVQTLASNVTSALAAGGPTLAGTAATITGTDGLTSWARHAARANHSSHHSSGGGSSNTDNGGGGSSSGTTVPNPYANGRDCGSGIYAGPNTSCDFAVNVYDAYWAAPGAAASVRVFSPVTGSYYSMNCSPAGSGVTCSGGNNASVTFGG